MDIYEQTSTKNAKPLRANENRAACEARIGKSMRFKSQRKRSRSLIELAVGWSESDCPAE